MLTGVFCVFEEKCVTHVPGGHEHLLTATPLSPVLHFITCWVLLGGQLFLQSSVFWCTLFHCLPKSFRKSGLDSPVLLYFRCAHGSSADCLASMPLYKAQFGPLRVYNHWAARFHGLPAGSCEGH